MRRSLAPSALVLLIATLPALLTAAPLRMDSAPRFAPDMLSFEQGDLSAWFQRPAGSISLDTTLVHGGRGAILLHRDDDTAESFSVFSRKLDADFAGETLELRGWIHTRDVVGWVGLWLRQDGDAGVVQFDNMQSRRLDGSRDWTQVSTRLPLHPEAKQVVFGALISGTGSLRVDDLELLIDGESVSTAPQVALPETVLDRDTEFDAGSGIELTELTDAQADHVALLGRVWGFLKYHHPKVTAGEHHWDYELFRVLPGVLAARDAADVQRQLTAWVDRLGVPTAITPMPAPPAADARPRADLAWLHDEVLLGAELSRWLVQVHRFRGAGPESFYVGFYPGVGNALFHHEATGPGGTVYDAGYRLLTLLRYWNMVEYWFPYRDLIDEPWPDVLRDETPRFVAAATPTDFSLALLHLIARVDDTHANLFSALSLLPPQGDAMWPIKLQWLDEGPTVTGLAGDGTSSSTGFRPGDILLRVDGQSVADIEGVWEPFACGSNVPARKRQLVQVLARGARGKGSATVLRDGAEIILQEPRTLDWQVSQHSHDRDGDTFQLLSDKIAYLKLSGVRQADVPSYVERAAGTRGLVIDIRNYPSEFMVFSLAPALLDEPTAFARFTQPDPGNPGAFNWTDPLTLSPGELRYRGGVAVLVDEASVSSSEYTAMALRCNPRAVVVGSTTAGADGNVSSLPLPGGFATRFSGIGVYYPDRSDTQRVGIVPDIPVRPTAAGVAAGRDEVLEAAVRHLLGDGADEAAVRAMCLRPGS